MARDKTYVDVDWQVSNSTWEAIIVAVLMDIRCELKQMNAIFQCPNALAIPAILRNIDTNTRKKRTRKK